MVVFLASYPRAGNTLFRLILRHVFGHSSYSITTKGGELFQQIGLDKLMLEPKVFPLPLHVANQSKDVYFLKTHLYPQEPYPAIHIVRDGRDCLVSFAHFVEKYYQKDKTGNWEQTLGRLIREVPGRSWAAHSMYWAGRANITIHFEDLLKDPVTTVGVALQMCNLTARPLNRQAPSFEELHEKWPDFFRRGKIGSWRDEMPGGLVRDFWLYNGMAMRELGYEV